MSRAEVDAELKMLARLEYPNHLKYRQKWCELLAESLQRGITLAEIAYIKLRNYHRVSLMIHSRSNWSVGSADCDDCFSCFDRVSFDAVRSVAIAARSLAAMDASECPTLEYFEGSAAMKDSYYCSVKPVPIDSRKSREVDEGRRIINVVKYVCCVWEMWRLKSDRREVKSRLGLKC